MPSWQLATTLITSQRTFNAMEPAATSESEINAQVTLAAVPAANVGTLSTRTDDDTGVATLSTGHTIVSSGLLVDVYWSGGARYGMTATKSTNDITLDGGAGDNLPAQSTAVTLCQQQLVEINFDGDDADFLSAIYSNPSDSGANAYADFQDDGDATIKAISLVEEKANAGIVKAVNVFNFANGDTNVFTGNRITAGSASHDSASAGTVYILVGINS